MVTEENAILKGLNEAHDERPGVFRKSLLDLSHGDSMARHLCWDLLKIRGLIDALETD
jgi:hypothetical protein